MKNNLRLLTVFAAPLVLLSACGGAGGEGGNSSAPPQPPPPAVPPPAPAAPPPPPAAGQFGDVTAASGINYVNGYLVGRPVGIVSGEIAFAGAAAGDYIAERLPDMSHSYRMALLTGLGDYGGERLHAALLMHLKQQTKLYEAYLAEHGPDAKDLIDDWNKLPAEITSIWGELYYGLVGLSKFRDKRDLDFVRELALWAIDHRFRF